MIFPFVGMLIPGLNKLEHQNKNMSRIAFLCSKFRGLRLELTEILTADSRSPLPPPPAVDVCRHALPEAARPVSRFFLLRPSVAGRRNRASERPTATAAAASSSQPAKCPSLPPSLPRTASMRAKHPSSSYYRS